MSIVNAKFQGLLDLEFEVRTATAVVAEHAEDVLHAALDTLAAEELAEYGEYRARVNEEIAKQRSDLRGAS